ncbi:hypothetical protein KE639_00036 [Streptomyces sp. V17-9]|nr:hypothetical protein KE639_00036 [Streptomyces sp. V17-9]
MPTELTPDPAHEDRAAHNRRPSEDVDQVPQAPYKVPSPTVPSTLRANGAGGTTRWNKVDRSSGAIRSTSAASHYPRLPQDHAK